MDNTSSIDDRIDRLTAKKRSFIAAPPISFQALHPSNHPEPTTDNTENNTSITSISDLEENWNDIPVLTDIISPQPVTQPTENLEDNQPLPPPPSSMENAIHQEAIGEPAAFTIDLPEIPSFSPQVTSPTIQPPKDESPLIIEPSDTPALENKELLPNTNLSDEEIKLIVAIVEKELTYELPTLIEAALCQIGADIKLAVSHSIQKTITEYFKNR